MSVRENAVQEKVKEGGSGGTGGEKCLWGERED